MHLILIAVAALIFASGILVKSLPQEDTNNITETENIEVNTQVLNTTDEATPTPISTSTTTNNPVTEPAPTPTSTTSSFIYPNSTLVSENNYQTSDDPEVVTNWYKEEIRSQNYNVKNFVSTSVNGEVENKLVGANSDSELEIIITKNNNSNITNINIINN